MGEASGMRVLVLGAGGVGGYFGGRLQEAGADVSFLVRPRRKAQLEDTGLCIKSVFGDYSGPAKALLAGEVEGQWDLILLTCKAYDLDSAIDSIRPAVGTGTAVLPLLNGLAHLDRLNSEFGSEHVLGGVAKIVVAMGADGTIQHMNDWRFITFGEQDGSMSERVLALQAAFPAESVVAKAVPDILQQMWEKIVHLSAAAGACCLMRASIGEIASAGGSRVPLELLELNAEIAACEGHRPADTFLADYRKLFADASSPYVPSMLRDIERGNPTEGQHIVGFMLEKARKHGLDASLYDLIDLHLKTYEVRRATGRLS
jgi:2-dehydropantoate 2-reductase